MPSHVPDAKPRGQVKQGAVWRTYPTVAPKPQDAKPRESWWLGKDRDEFAAAWRENRPQGYRPPSLPADEE